MAVTLAALFAVLVAPCAADAAGKSAWLGKRILWVDSYAADYEWSQEIEKGIRLGLSGMGVELSIARMDTKNKMSSEERREAGSAVKKVIDALKPDLIIASDDNAQEYVIVPYVKETSTPVVFCGVNWDVSMYGYPTPTITGMVEIDPVAELYTRMKRYAKGPRIAFLGGESETLRKMWTAYRKLLAPQELPGVFVASFEEFKKEYVRLQQDADMLLFANNAEIPGWSEAEAEALIQNSTRIPTGSLTMWMAPLTTFVMGKDPSEQGEFAASAALRILGGASPASIPIAANERYSLTVNLKLADAAGIFIPLSTLRSATVIGHENPGK
jgi:hypothetical protein